MGSAHRMPPQAPSIEMFALGGHRSSLGPRGSGKALYFDENCASIFKDGLALWVFLFPVEKRLPQTAFDILLRADQERIRGNRFRCSCAIVSYCNLAIVDA